MDKVVKKYVLRGVGLGLVFPVLAIIVQSLENGLGCGIDTVIQVHKDTRLLYIIDMAPLVLGFAGFKIGINQAKLIRLAKELEKKSGLTDDKLELVNYQLEQKNTDLNNLSYASAHDLKSALRGISSCVALIREDTGEDIAELEKFQSLLDNRISRMDSLLDALLRYMRLGQSSDEKEVFNFKRALENGISSLNSERVSMKIIENVENIYFDKDKFQIILKEIFENSLNFSKSDKTKIFIEAHDIGTYTSVEISDDGQGIDNEYHERVFGMFTTLQKRDDMESMGMGLAIVKRIMNDAGGEVKMVEKEGKGTTIELKIINK